MSMREDIARYRAAGLAHDHMEIDGPRFAKLVAPMLNAIAKDPTLVVGTRTDTIDERGQQTEWHYLIGRRQEDGKVAPLADGEDDCAFNISWPCPPCEPPPNGG